MYMRVSNTKKLTFVIQINVLVVVVFATSNAYISPTFKQGPLSMGRYIICALYHILHRPLSANVVYGAIYVHLLIYKVILVLSIS